MPETAEDPGVDVIVDTELVELVDAEPDVPVDLEPVVVLIEAKPSVLVDAEPGVTVVVVWVVGDRELAGVVADDDEDVAGDRTVIMVEEAGLPVVDVEAVG